MNARDCLLVAAITTVLCCFGCAPVEKETPNEWGGTWKGEVRDLPPSPLPARMETVEAPSAPIHMEPVTAQAENDDDGYESYDEGEEITAD